MKFEVNYPCKCFRMLGNIKSIDGDAIVFTTPHGTERTVTDKKEFHDLTDAEMVQLAKFHMMSKTPK